MEKATSFKSDCELMMMPVDHHELLVEDALALLVEGGRILRPTPAPASGHEMRVGESEWSADFADSRAARY